MGSKGLDFKHKEVINVGNAKRLGYVQDVCADLETGTITSIIVPGERNIKNVFSGANDIVIPWEKIKCIGDDVILVDIWKIAKYVFRLQKYFDFNSKKKKTKKYRKKLKKVLTRDEEYVNIRMYQLTAENNIYFYI